RTAKTSRHKLATRLSPGEKRGRKRMAEVGAVCDAAPVPRAPADIISAPGHAGGQERSRKKGPVAAGKWLTASVTDDIPAVITAVFDEAAPRDHARARTRVALADGNNQQIEAITPEHTSELQSL